jgi:tRNA/tmRNA/rRNA uracil-C5-methylase (TrmA/RlmC/RlmD family)
VTETVPPASLAGEIIELDVGPVAHGGHCVARIGDAAGGRVVFVRHAIPGERVRVRITEDAGGSFARGDAISVITPSEDRVEPPCPHAGPGRCGGCDWQHVRPAAQRDLKAAVVREQFARLAKLDVAVEVTELPGGPLHWRTRVGYTIDQHGRPGLLRHRSPVVEAVESCPLGVAGVGDSPVLAQSWPDESRVEVVRDDQGSITVLAARTVAPKRTYPNGRRPRIDRRRVLDSRIVQGAEQHHHLIAADGDEPVDFAVAPSGFWQVHPAAAPTFVRTVLRELAPRPGESALDLYAGAGLFTAFLARAVGPSGRVIGIEADAQAVSDAATNLIELPWAEVRRSPVTAALFAQPELVDRAPDLVILDPPRSGVGAEVMAAVLALGARTVAYVACDPASLARDVRVAIDQGWAMSSLSVFDAFPMTHHIECIAILRPTAPSA